MRIIVVAITLITLIAVVVVSILYGTDLFIPGLKPTPTPTPTPTVTLTPTPALKITDCISLIENLREAGATVVDTGEFLRQPCFSVDAKVITVNGSDVQVFEYEDATAADTEAAFISPDGFSININGQICGYGWVAPPHFYKASNLIVLYVGDNKTAIDVLETVLDPQFAGQ